MVREDRIIHCETDGCETHQRTAASAGAYPAGWTVVTDHHPHESVTRAFCSWDCVLKFGMTIPPVEHVGDV